MAGETLGHFEITDKLGEGGIGLSASAWRSGRPTCRKRSTRRRRWVDRFSLRAKIAADDAGPGGMIQHLPIERRSTVEGAGLYFILCIWVHGTSRGGRLSRGTAWAARSGAAEEDARALGAQGHGGSADRAAFHEVDTSEQASVAAWASPTPTSWTASRR